MKSLEDLAEIRERTKALIQLKDGTYEKRVVVGMATCGISAGARPVFDALKEEVESLGLSDKIEVTQTGCIGICQYEPVFEVYEAGKEGKVTYVKMDAEKAKKVAEEHLKNGNIVYEYTIGYTKL